MRNVFLSLLFFMFGGIHINNLIVKQKNQLKLMAMSLLEKDINFLSYEEFKYQLSTIAKELQKDNNTDTYDDLHNYICIDLNRLYEYKKKQIKNKNISLYTNSNVDNTTTNKVVTTKNLSNNNKSATIKRSVASAYSNKYVSFSGHDMVCIFEIPVTGGTLSSVIGSLQTVTYSVHNEKFPVRSLGNMNAKGYVYGPRTIAGSLIFTVFNKHWAHDLMERYLDTYKVNAHFLVDELPPLNITISFANEYGNKARMALYGVTFVNEGQVMSINDNYTENTFQFFATDIDYLDNIQSSKYNNSNGNSKLPDLPDSNNGSSTNITTGNAQSNNQNEENDNNNNVSTIYFENIRNEITEYLQFSSKIPPVKANDLLIKLSLERTDYIEKINKQYKDKKISEKEKQEEIDKINQDYRMLKDIIANNIGTDYSR